MKKSWIYLLVLTVSLMSLVSAEVRINEVELNPGGSDSGFEWIELYSENSVDLNGWKIINEDNQSLNLNQSFEGYFAINLKGQWLDNSDEKIYLYNENLLIDETILFSDSENNNKTWQYCNGNWNFTFETKNSANSCHIDNSNNETYKDNKNNEEDKISLSVNWDEEDIINGEEFNIKISAENLEGGDYDVRIWIENDDEEIISERYGKNDDEDIGWKSGNYYANDFFSGSGDKSNKIKLRIKDSFSDFSGDAKIIIKIRENGKSSVIDENEDNIEILEKENVIDEKESIVDINKNSETLSNPPILNSPITGEIIKLGVKSKNSETKSIEGELLYESPNEKIKLYSFFGFASLCLFFAILIIFKKIK